MGYTSTAVKRKYNAKTYSRWVVDLRKQDYETIEQLRGDMSRAAFLKSLLDKVYPDWQQSKQEDAE